MFTLGRVDPAHRYRGLGAECAEPAAKLQSKTGGPVKDITFVTAINLAGRDILTHHLTFQHDGDLVIPEVDLEHAHGLVIGGGGVHDIAAVGWIDEL